LTLGGKFGNVGETEFGLKPKEQHDGCWLSRRLVANVKESIGKHQEDKEDELHMSVFISQQGTGAGQVLVSAKTSTS
jgi:hypothetical protein